MRATAQRKGHDGLLDDALDISRSVSQGVFEPNVLAAKLAQIKRGESRLEKEYRAAQALQFIAKTFIEMTNGKQQLDHLLDVLNYKAEALDQPEREELENMEKLIPKAILHRQCNCC